MEHEDDSIQSAFGLLNSDKEKTPAERAGAYMNPQGLMPDRDSKAFHDVLVQDTEHLPAMADARDLLVAILESAGDGIAMADTQGEFLVFNPEAKAILGLGAIKGGPGEWPSTYGLFYPDGVTPFPPDELPLARAIQGFPSDRVEMFVRNQRNFPGRLLSVNARPVKDKQGRLRGGVATFNDITDLRRAQEQLLVQAVTDDMTMIPNHRAFWQRLNQLVAEGGRGRHFCLVMADIDHFKRFNDKFGHQMGDYVLIAVANALNESVRKTDLVARYGGEEFCVLFTDVDEHAAVAMAEKLRARVATIDAPERVTMSFGVRAYEVGCHGSDGQGLIREADAAMYQAKLEGRDRVVAFSGYAAAKK